MDYVDETQKLSLRDTEDLIDDEESLENVLKLFGDLALKIEQGSEVEMSHPSEFYYEAAKEVSQLKDRINELELILEGARNGVERYVFGPLDIVDEKGEVIASLDEWMSRELIEGAITTYVTKAIVRGLNIMKESIDADK